MLLCGPLSATVLASSLAPFSVANLAPLVAEEEAFSEEDSKIMHLQFVLFYRGTRVPAPPLHTLRKA